MYISESIDANYIKVKNLIEDRNSADDIYDYNCMGWALDREEWLHPRKYFTYEDREVRRWEYLENIVRDFSVDLDLENEERVVEEITKQDVESLIKNFGLRYATKEEIEDTDYPLIAFSEYVDYAFEPEEEYWTVYDTDFHFLKRVDGIWTEKLGHNDIQFCDLNNVYSIQNGVWEGGYCGPVVFLVKE